MAKNKVTDLTDHLMEAIEWVGDRDLKGEELKEQITRSETICKLAQQYINAGNLALNAVKVAASIEDKDKNIKMPLMLTNSD
jgi:hypothetical protein